MDRMKTPLPLVCLGTLVLGVSVVGAQVVVPATPKKFTKRSLSETTSNGGSVGIGVVNPPATAKVRYITHVTLSEPRQWQSSDGKSLLGRLIAFEDITVETEKGAPPPPFTPPANPTVVKGGKARLLVDTKPFELPLERLSQGDQDFVEQIRAAVAAKAAAAPPQPKPAAK